MLKLKYQNKHSKTKYALRAIFCFCTVLILSIPISLVTILVSFIKIKLLKVLFSIVIVVGITLYLRLSFNWIRDISIHNLFILELSMYVFGFIIFIGIIFTAGLGLLFTFPTIFFIIYLIAWHRKKYHQYLYQKENNKKLRLKLKNLLLNKGYGRNHFQATETEKPQSED